MTSSPPPAEAARSCSTVGSAAGLSAPGCGCGRRRQTISDLLQVAGELAQARNIRRVIFHQLANLSDQLLGARFLVQRHPVAKILYLPLHLIGDRVGGVARFDLFAPLAVFFGMGLGVGDHAVDFFLG